MREIYILLLHLRTGGVEIISVNLANALVKRGYHVTLVSLLRDNELSNILDKRVRIEYLSDSFPKKSLWFKIKWRLLLYNLIRKLKSIHKSIVISTRDEYNILVSKYCGNDNLRIAQLHHDYYGSNSLIKHFKYFYSNIDYFTILTPDVTDEIKKIISPYNQHTKVITIPNFQPSTKFVSNKDISQYGKYILSPLSFCIAVGRLSKEKGFDRLIKVWDDMNKRYSDIPVLLIAGEGSELFDLKDLITKYNLEDKVFLLGSISNEMAQQYIANSLCYCMSSYSEGFPLVILEALSNGTPQVAFDVRVGPRNLILHNKTGYLIEDNDLVGYTDAVMEIYNNRDIRDSMSRNSIKRSAMFSEDNVLSQWEKILNK